MRRRTVGPRFEVVDRYRPFELLAPRFVAVEEQLSYDGLRRSDWSPPAPFVTVEALAAAPVVQVGLAAANGDHLLGSVSAGVVRLEVRSGGISTTLRERRVRGRVRRVALVLCENQPTVLVETRRGWRPVLTEKHRVAPRLDFRRPETLARFTAAWQCDAGTAGADATGAGATSSGTVRAGLFGMTGLRDLHLVQHADGSPYLRDGRMYFTATCAGLGFFQQAHWGVFAFDPATYRLEQTAHLFARRNGMLLGDHAGQLVCDGDTWLVANSSWGDFSPSQGTHVRHTTSTADLLEGVHLLQTERTPLPTRLATYDPGMIRIDGRWHVSYVQSPSQRDFDFHLALAVGPAGAKSWSDRLELVGADTELHQCEGPVLATLPRDAGDPGDAGDKGDAGGGAVGEPGGTWRVLASDGHARRYRVYDLAMKRLGDLDAPYGSNIPHPQVVETPRGERLLVTFDGTQYAKRVLGYGAHGDVVVMRQR